MAAPTCTDDDASMEFHCEGTGCTWWRCPTCAAVYDTDRGYRITKAGVVESTAE